MEGGEMVELMKSRWMHVAMAMAALTAGCAAGEAGADEIDMDEPEAVEVEETSQALCGSLNPRNCGWGNRWGNSGGGWGPDWGGWGGGWNKPFNRPCGGGDWGGSWKPFNYGNYSPGWGNGWGGGWGGGYGGGCGRW
ncbi:hypothetical protein [Sorangium sp. So ce861]|uniref:hypothetical protein n=1 Tax=Sorangium sp. So ce861 TaxID=3133323 RepID=UPI003F62F46D